MDNNVIKSTTTIYWIEVWDIQHGPGRYVEWGVRYYNAKKALKCFKDYLDSISPNGKLANSSYYQEQYKGYTSKPIKLMSQMYETYKYPEKAEYIDDIDL